MKNTMQAAARGGDGGAGERDVGDEHVGDVSAVRLGRGRRRWSC